MSNTTELARRVLADPIESDRARTLAQAVLDLSEQRDEAEQAFGDAGVRCGQLVAERNHYKAALVFAAAEPCAYPVDGISGGDCGECFSCYARTALASESVPPATPNPNPRCDCVRQKMGPGPHVPGCPATPEEEAAR